MLHDVGEHLPLAKKFLNKSEAHASDDSATEDSKITLSALWPEPKWQSMHYEGYDTDVIVKLYCIYHGLNKKPHSASGIRWAGESITVNMWQDAYADAVRWIRAACENTYDLHTLKHSKAAFDEAFQDASKQNTYRTYAAGKKTRKSFYHPFHPQGPIAQLEKLLPHLDFPLSINPKRIKLFPIKVRYKNPERAVYKLCKVNQKSVSWTEGDDQSDYINEFETYDAAVEALLAHHGEEFAVNVVDERQAVVNPKKSLDGIQGVVDDYEDVEPTRLMSDYGFRGVQFGNYLSQHERQSFVNNCFDSLRILSDLLNIPNHWIGGRKLGLAFGARGHGGASAHYELDLHIINLTRFNGAGCIAHELFHSFDARMCQQWTGHDGLLSALICKGVTLNVAPQHQERYQAFEQLVRACTDTRSDYVKNAQSLSGQKHGKSYWSAPEELCARAFEAYVQDNLLLFGERQQWLAYRALEQDYPTNGKHPYPIGIERKKLNQLLDESLSTIFHQC
ncbi:hypothetical protein K0504_09935 [Neiella marina]|uniref:Large polyvalent protein-associated domain-containing protein n=1 Tax=Neiella holothuriorum TaxID=2870530 RepID=A0ABS7EG95_9GAMM|nr:LPD1 domain-containing protein [Neiella holothuriorum]MBW8191357.1 hypothetical protein [Neiella holothuriorum]